jgi:hypothetical protein
MKSKETEVTPMENDQPEEGKTRKVGHDSKKSRRRQQVNQKLDDIARQYNQNGEAEMYKGQDISTQA